MVEHIACIMDGNRRWAKQHNLPLKQGVLEGLQRVQTAVDVCLERAVPYLSMYAFSIENLQRSAFERACYFGVICEYGIEYAHNMASKGVRVRCIGDRGLLPEDVAETCDQIEKITQDGKKLSLQLLICYGGRQEIVAAVQALVRAVAEKKISPDIITEQVFRDHLWMHSIPDPDVIIRTGFAQRLSNFLLYEGAYAELYFPTCLWPDMHEERFDEVFAYLKTCTRNLGK